MLKGYQNIEEIKRRLVERFNPQAIILFGSYAWGEPTEDSDLDVLVVKDSNLPSRKMEVEAQKILLDIDQPLDLFVYTPQAFREKENSFFKRIKNQGKVIYGYI